jgi:membrane-associated phospholipid phosphatase
LKRRFQSGIEAGFWYTLTNGNDITSPGPPSRPYHDKGLYVSIPLGSLLTKDTQALVTYTLAPWTRDVGQMVVSPGDLYTLMEKPAMIDMHDRDGLVMFGDREDDYNLPSLGTSVLDRPLMKIARDDWSHAVDVLGSIDTWEKVGLGAGLIASSAALDHIAFRAADKHRENSILKASIKAGNALPVALLAGSGLIALGDFEPRISNTALASIQAGVVGLGLNQAIKFAVGRSRPTDSLGNTNFHPFSASNLHSSFTSNHTTAMWAAITPYAKEYEMPWLYGVADFTNLARVGSREHWVSDTVASSLLGYAVGSLFWQWRRTADDASPQFVVIPNGVGISWKTH